jgi:hypothetical protein
MTKESDLINHHKRNRGMTRITQRAGAAVFNRIMGQDSAQLVVAADVDWPVFLARYPVNLPLIQHLGETNTC